jgi:UDP-GlcNAc3NAcA epimerase
VKILTVIGARPQFIKAAAVSRIIRETEGVEEVLIHTGQHYDQNMSDVFFEELEIPKPKHHLGIGGGSHGQQTGRMLEKLEAVLVDEQPDWVLVYGDTNSTLAGALAAVKLHIPVAHVEAGLRSFNRRMPEEINRVLTDHASELLFAPTQAAVANLKNEGLAGGKVRCVGDVMYDVALFFGKKAERQGRVLDELGLEPKGYILSTIHRAENTDDPKRLKVVFDALAEIASEVKVVLPLHPRTRKALEALGMLADVERSLDLVEPLGYLDMVMLEKNAKLIATDSGGVQKEAFFYHVPCVTLRDETEWVELVDMGWNRLAPPLSTRAVVENIRLGMSVSCPADLKPYGEGNSAELIVRTMASSL